MMGFNCTKRETNVKLKYLNPCTAGGHSTLAVTKQYKEPEND